MSKILEKYENTKDLPFTQGYPDAKTLDGKSFQGTQGGRYTGDATPYSLGNGFAGKKDIDEEGLKAVEKRNAKGNRYQVGEFGGGYKNAKGYTDKNKYTSVMASKK